MTTELPPPGVSIIQKFRTVSPTILQPTLPACCVGPSFQVIEALTTDAAGSQVVNSDALASLPPIITSLNSEDFVGLDGLTLKVQVNGGAAQEVTFSDPTAAGLTVDQVKSQILSTSGISGWAPYAIERGASVFLQLRGNTAGDNQTLRILDGTANDILGFYTFFEASGFSLYTQDKRFISQANFPDPRGNLDELDIQEASIRVFLKRGSGLLEVKRDETFLRNGSSCYLVGSTVTAPTVGLNGKTLIFKRGLNDPEETITFDGDFCNNTNGTKVVPTNAYANPGTDSFKIQRGLDAPITVTFSSPADIDAAVTAINAAWAAVYPATTVAYRSTSNGTANPAGTYISYKDSATPAIHVKVIEGTTGNAFVDLGFVSGQGAVYSTFAWFVNHMVNNVPVSTYNFLEPFIGAGDPTLFKVKMFSYNGYLRIGAGTANSILGLTEGTEVYAVTAIDDGDGDTKTPLLEIQTENFSYDAYGASVVFDNDISGANAAHRLTFEVALDGYPMQTIEFNGGPIVPTNAYSTPGTNSFALIVNGTTYVVTFTTPVDIADAILEINTAVGQTVCYRATSGGVPSPSGTYIAFQVGGEVDAGGSVEIVYGVPYSAAFTALGFTGVANIEQTVTGAEIVDQINATFGDGFASLSGGYLYLASPTVGVESKIEVGNGTANTIIGLLYPAATGLQLGGPFKPKAGDAFYADGELMGYITVVMPSAVANRIRLDREVTISSTKKRNWYIVAKNIASPLPADRPTPDLVVDLSGDLLIKHDILRDTKGNPIALTSDQILIAYTALRLDVTSRAANPALLSFESVDELESLLAPVNTDNPLALAIFFSLINGTGVVTNGLGIDAVSADYPEGTLEAYTRALSFLESADVYGLVPLTHEPTVHQAFISHVDSMSEPDNRGERVVIFNPEMPARNLDTLVTSGTDGDTVSTNVFDTKLSSLASDLLAAGVDPTGTLTVEEGVFLDIAADSKRYSISEINGSEVTIRVAFAPGENDDSFYAVSNLPGTLISETFSIKVRGAALVDANGDPDNAAIAAAYAALGQSYKNRRAIMTAPDKMAATIGGLEQVIAGYYGCAGIAGMTAKLPPQQGLTNYPMTGYSRVIGSTERFSRSQMNVAAGGGVYWFQQEVKNGPVLSRHQLTTDLTSVETREYSITRIVDYTAKFLRAGIRSFIGKYNVTQGFLDMLSTVVQGLLGYLTDTGTLIGGDINNIIQDTTQVDMTLIDVTLDVPVPSNYIRLTLVV